MTTGFRRAGPTLARILALAVVLVTAAPAEEPAVEVPGPATAAGALAATAPLSAPGSLTTGELTDPLLLLPTLPPPQPMSPGLEQEPRVELGPGVLLIRQRAVILPGTLNLDQGPADGLEVLACLAGGKVHEALIRLDATSGVLVKTACIAALGLSLDGEGSVEASGQPARGVPLQLTVRWNAGGTTVAWAASSLIRDRVSDRPYPTLPWLYTGSRSTVVAMAGANGRTINREVFLLDSTKSIAVTYDEPDALLASPFPGARRDDRFEANSAVLPPAGTRVELVLEPCHTPLTLAFTTASAATTASGTRRQEMVSIGSGSEATSQPVDGPALGQALARRYGPESNPTTRAVAVLVDPTAPRSADLVIRERILAEAARVGAWVVPVFVVAP